MYQDKSIIFVQLFYCFTLKSKKQKIKNMAIEFTKPVIIGLIIFGCILLFVMVVDVVPCSSSESFSSTTEIEDIIQNINNERTLNNEYMNLMKTNDDDIKNMYNTMFIIKNRINELQ